LRFDDMIETVLAGGADRPGRLAASWRQLVDLLAQRRGGGQSAAAERAYAFLAAHRDEVDADQRRRAAESLRGLAIDPRLLAFFAEDRPAVAAPLIGGARLSAEAWLALLPRLGPSARALLRHRRDLPEEVTRALASFGSSDLVLEGGEPRAAAAANAAAEPPSPAAARSEAQIRDLVARIEAYRRRREAAPPSPPAPVPEDAPEETGPVEGFRWETGPEGIVQWVDGAPRGALIGQTIAAIAPRGQYGVDGQAAGAFEKRAPFRDARFSIAGEGPASGDWRISGVPCFDPQRGHFLGYRGTARRPRLDEVAHATEGSGGNGLYGTQFPADSLRQLIHELRTPLNAIIGFSEMIEGQYMGPAAAPYRGRATEITEQARRLLAAVDDLDTAARIEGHRLDLLEAECDAVALVCRLHDAYERVAAQRGSRLQIEINGRLPAAAVEEGAAERMFARMLAATIGLAGDGEAIGATMRLEPLEGREMLCLSIDRPAAIAGRSEADLLDPGYSPDGDWPGAPALGLGFALRLVRNLAEAAGGALRIGPRRFSLFLPPAGDAGRAAEGGREG
jgi:hypothetical protein